MNQNDFIVREGHKCDLQSIADLFRRHDYGPKNLEWIQWNYLENPDGPACLFLVEDSDGSIAGFWAFLPQQFTSEKTGAFFVRQGVDVFVAAELRKKGIFSKLSRYAQKTLASPRIGFPNDASLPFVIRSGWRIIAL